MTLEPIGTWLIKILEVDSPLPIGAMCGMIFALCCLLLTFYHPRLKINYLNIWDELASTLIVLFSGAVLGMVLWPIVIPLFMVMFLIFLSACAWAIIDFYKVIYESMFPSE